MEDPNNPDQGEEPEQDNPEDEQQQEPEGEQPGKPEGEEQKDMFQDEDDYLTADHVLNLIFG